MGENMKKEDELEELKEWEQERKVEEKEQYGIDLQDVKPQKIKWIDRLAEFLKGISYTCFFLVIVIFILVILFVGFYLYAEYKYVKSQVDIDVEGTIESMYNIKIKIISKDTDDQGNGNYTLKLKNKDVDITFNAVKHLGQLKEDYIDNCQKYFFDKWSSENKKNFKVIEKKDGIILNYESFIEINNYEEMEQAVDWINEFHEFCKNDFFRSWNVYIKYEENRIYPFISFSETKEEALNNAKNNFKDIIDRKNIINEVK